MIFAAVGTQLPFPRLIRALDDIAGRHRLDMFAQTADPAFSGHAIESVPFLSAAEFDARVAGCRLVVAHAGMGVMLTAARFGKPLIVMPRDAGLGEHRNDHQRDMAIRFEGLPGLRIVRSDEELEQAICGSDLLPLELGVSERRPRLIAALSAALRPA